MRPPPPAHAFAPHAVLGGDHGARGWRRAAARPRPARRRSSRCARCLVSSPRETIDLLDARVVGPRRAVGALDERDAVGAGPSTADGVCAVAPVHGRGRDGLRAAACACPDAMWAAVSAARAMAVQREVVGVGVAGALARHHAHAEAAGHARGGGADDPFLEQERRGPMVLEVEVGEAARRARGRARAASPSRARECRRGRARDRRGTIATLAADAEQAALRSSAMRGVQSERPPRGCVPRLPWRG